MKKLLIAFALTGFCFTVNAERPKVSLWNRLFGDVNNALRTALLYNNKQAAINALKAGADPNYRGHDGSGNPLIYLAITKNGSDVVDQMLENGLDLKNIPFSYGRTALSEAVSKDFPLETLQKMVEAGADPNQVDKTGATALFHAKNKEQVSRLQSLGARLDVLLPNGNTLLQYYVMHGTPEMVSFLLKNGADANDGGQDGFKPLHSTAFLKDGVAKAKLLVKYGADIYAKTKLGAMPLTVAQALGNEPLYNYLLSISK